MPIQFIPNDPLAPDVPPRQQSPRPDPPAAQARFSHPAAAAEGVFPLGTAEFLFWQCREAALAALETWSTLAQPLLQWRGGGKLLPLIPNAGEGLEAHYDRSSVAFYGWTGGGKTTWAGASTDAVAHEVGHALLDAIRPDLWESNHTEGAAFHEAFADCVSLLVGMSDGAVRHALLSPASTLRTPNFLEAIAEDVADGIHRHDGPQHPQALPRRALNTFLWEIPINLPPLGAPSVLTAEAHSFGRIFTGCFYDTLCNVFDQQPHHDEQGLFDAARIVGRLLVTAAHNAPEVPRFFQAVGRAMILADESANGGRYRDAIRQAFVKHNIALGTSAMLAPSSGLVGAAPSIGSTGRAQLAPDTHRHLLKRLRAPRGGKLQVSAATLGDRAVTKAVHQRGVPLGAVDRTLRAVTARAAECVLVGASAARAVVLGQLPDPLVTVDEVQHFVMVLLEAGRLDPERRTSGRQRQREEPLRPPSHVVRTRNGKKVLTRIRFSCGA